MNHNGKVAALGAAAILAAGAAGAALAHPHPEGDADGKKVERIVVIHEAGKDEHHAAAGDRRMRRFELHGADLVGCEKGDKLVDETAGEGDKQTKVIVCTHGAPTAATADRLEKALARITANDDLSDEQKARIETALRSAIDRARSAR